MFISALRFYLPTLLSCLTRSGIKHSGRGWLDYRYFYPDKSNIGQCTCGLAKQAGAIVIRQVSLDSDDWLHALRAFEHNRSVIGFIVEQACLSTISRTGFHYGTINWGSFPVTIFDGDLLSAIPDGNCEFFFIPRDPFFRDINALYLKVDDKKKTVLLVPIQITIAKEHANSEAGFYSRWPAWLNRFEGYKVETAFVWVVEDDHSWETIEEEIKTRRSCSMIQHSAHQQIVIKVEEVNPALGIALAAIRRR